MTRPYAGVKMASHNQLGKKSWLETLNINRRQENAMGLVNYSMNEGRSYWETTFIHGVDKTHGVFLSSVDV